MDISERLKKVQDQIQSRNASRSAQEIEQVSRDLRGSSIGLRNQAIRMIGSLKGLQKVAKSSVKEYTDLAPEVRESAQVQKIVDEYLKLSDQAQNLWRKLESLQSEDRAEQIAAKIAAKSKDQSPKGKKR